LRKHPCGSAGRSLSLRSDNTCSTAAKPAATLRQGSTAKCVDGRYYEAESAFCQSDSETRQHFLNFWPLPPGQGSLRPTFPAVSCGDHLQLMGSRAQRLRFSISFSSKADQVDSSATVSPHNAYSLLNRRCGAAGCSSAKARSSSKSLKRIHSVST